MSKKPTYPPFEKQELARAFGFLRGDERYADLMPPRKTLLVDWFLLRAIGNEVEKRRTPRIKLALLTGTVVREFVPDVTPETRRLGKAYRDAVMYMFRERRRLQRLSKKSPIKRDEHPESKPKQLRLI